MQDLYSNQITLEAELEYRRRHLASLRRSVPVHSAPRRRLRGVLAELLAHLALHLDGRSISTVSARHADHPSPVARHPHRGAA
jgi:hypothetical protein